jgi:murein DD-endopeptidase MepM/ murein hydrolase activator NlpD
VEFLNGYGTPVLAAADGVVVVAGEDRQPTSAQGVWPITFYGPYSYFYGNLVVIEHQATQGLLRSFPELPQPVYTLYGHLSQISVQVGQQVAAGQEIGKVGMTGIAEGSHLHFEVRLGENSYKASRNPELWLKPHTDNQGRLMGGIAGRVLNSFNVNLQVSSIVIERLEEGAGKPGAFQITLLSYEEKSLISFRRKLRNRRFGGRLVPYLLSLPRVAATLSGSIARGIDRVNVEIADLVDPGHRML